MAENVKFAAGHAITLPTPYRLTLRLGAATILMVCASGAWAGGAWHKHSTRIDRDKIDISSISTRADAVTGGDVLVRIELPEDVRHWNRRKHGDGVLNVQANGRDVTSAFRPHSDANGVLLGLVENLREGRNRIVASTGRHKSAKLNVVNRPITGPVFSGPHQEPFVCQTESFQIPVIGETLGPPIDENCSALTRVDYVYRSTDGSFKALPDPSLWPGDVAETTTIDGHTVPYIVRLETGTINRAIYQIGILHEPGTASPDPWTSTNSWNGRLVYSFGGGCNAAYRQGSSTGSVLDNSILSQGYAMASSSFNVFGNNCNDVTSAETVMMVKEHFIESFGDPGYTIGFGCSGGSMQPHLVAHNYPGLLDGIVPQCSYPDIVTIVSPVIDCSLISRAIDEGAQPWTLEELSAVTGYANNGTIETCTLWNNFFSPAWITPTGCSVPDELLYDPVTNPGGARCTVHDNTVNVYGRDRVTGFARRPWDNVGVQYGLQAFNDGVVSFEQFVELNELAGGYDVDGNLVPERTAADRKAIRAAYRTGRVNSGAGGLADIPIIDVRGYTDVNVDIHDRFRSFSTRERLIAANGSADNQVIWIGPREVGITGGPYRYEALRVMDEWLDAIGQDTGRGPAAEKMVRNKPADATDTCWTSDGVKIVEPASYDGPGQCNELYPSHADPRIVAGAPLANDVLACKRKALDPRDYGAELTSDQWQRLRAAFPDGVCDYSRSGVAQRPLKSTWLAYPEPGRAKRMGESHHQR